MGKATLQRYLEKSNEKLNIKADIFNFFSHHLSKKTIFQQFLMIRRPPRSTQGVSSAASDVYKRQNQLILIVECTSIKLNEACVGNHPRRRNCLLYTSPSPRDGLLSRMPSSA